jgi:hypothetical protein
MHVAVVVFKRFDEPDAVGPLEVFGHARSRGADVEVRFRHTTPTLSCVQQGNTVASSLLSQITADE